MLKFIELTFSSSNFRKTKIPLFFVDWFLAPGVFIFGLIGQTFFSLKSTQAGDSNGTKYVSVALLEVGQICV